VSETRLPAGRVGPIICREHAPDSWLHRLAGPVVRLRPAEVGVLDDGTCEIEAQVLELRVLRVAALAGLAVHPARSEPEDVLPRPHVDGTNRSSVHTLEGGEVGVRAGNGERAAVRQRVDAT